VRPERIRLVPPDSPEAILRASVVLIEPLGSKNVVHLEHESHALRTITPAGEQPRIGENLGVAFDPTALHLFDDATGLALR